MIEPCCHDTVCPQPLGSQLIHLPAGGNGVAASHHPVVGGRGHNHPNPPYKAADKSSQVQAGGHHLGALVGTAGQDSARGAERSRPERSRLQEREGWGWAGAGPCSGCAENSRLPLPSSVPGRGQSCLQPHSPWEERVGSPNFYRSIRSVRGDGGCAEGEMRGSHPTGLEKRAGGIFSNANKQSDCSKFSVEGEKLRQCLPAEL